MAKVYIRATIKAIGCRFDSQLNIHYFHVTRQMCGVEFRHSTRNALRIRWKVRNRSILMERVFPNSMYPGTAAFDAPFSLTTPLGINRKLS